MRPSPNVGVAHGAWGEDVAVERLRLEGYQILDRNVRPCAWDKRLEIDIVAYDRSADSLVFVEVKQHKTHSDGERRLRSVTAEKRRKLRMACNAWRHVNRWQGNYRFDVVEVFGVPGTRRPEVDHVRRDNLFVRPVQFVRWG